MESYLHHETQKYTWNSWNTFLLKKLNSIDFFFPWYSLAKIAGILSESETSI